MPAKSAKQEKFMRAVAHSPSFAKKVGVPMSVGKEFTSKGNDMKKVKKMAFGGLPTQANARATAATAPRTAAPAGGQGNAGGAMRGLDRAAAMSGRTMPAAGVGMRPAGMKKGGMAASKMGKVKTAAPSIDGVAKKGRTSTKMVTMKRGGKC